MPPYFTMAGDLMLMQNLNIQVVKGLLAIGFRLTDRSSELWTRRFNAVKNGNGAAVSAGARTLALAFDSVPAAILKPPVVVVGAIGSSATSLDAEVPVAVLGKAVADRHGWAWSPEVLSKTVHRSLHGLSAAGASAGARDAEVRGRYLAHGIQRGPGTFLVVDDFCTRGATFGDITRALLAANPRWAVWGTALGKTENASYWDGDISNNHIPERLETAWTTE